MDNSATCVSTALRAPNATCEKQTAHLPPSPNDTRGPYAVTASKFTCGVRLWNEGRFVQGKAELPYPKRDFWAAANLSQPASWVTDADSNKNYLSIFDPPGVNTMADFPPIFVPCKADQCDGGTEFACAPGYTGTLCSECKPGQFFFRGLCHISCEDIEPHGVVTVFGIAAVVGVWLILNFIPSKFPSLTSGVAYGPPLTLVCCSPLDCCAAADRRLCAFQVLPSDGDGTWKATSQRPPHSASDPWTLLRRELRRSVWERVV